MQRTLIFLNSQRHLRTILRAPTGGLGRHCLLTEGEITTLVEEGVPSCGSHQDATNTFTFDTTEDYYHSAMVGEEFEALLVLSILVRFGVIAPIEK